MPYVKKNEKFERVNRAKITMKQRSKRTRTGAMKTGRIRAHGKHHKHI